MKNRTERSKRGCLTWTAVEEAVVVRGVEFDAGA